MIVQNFLPKPGTAMRRAEPCPPEDLVGTIAAGPAGRCRPRSTCRRPPNLSDDLAPLLDAGIDDWGGVSPVTADHVNPERAWPALAVLREATEAAGHVLAPRLTVYPTLRPATPSAGSTRRCASRCSTPPTPRGWPRDTAWCSGGEMPPPDLLGGPGRPTRRDAARGDDARLGRGGAVAEVLAGVRLGQEVGEDEIVTLFGARGPEVRAVAEVADELRREAVGDVVTFVRNRNINYTNVCTFKCRFCAFSKGPLSLNLRGAPYLLELDEVTRGSPRRRPRAPPRSACRAASTPTSTATTTSTCSRPCGAASATIHIHGFTALEVTEGARRSGVPAGRLPDAAARRRPEDAAGHRGRDPRRRGPRASSAPTRSTPRSGSRPTGPPTRSGCAPT